MSWIHDIINRAGQPFRNYLDSIKSDVDEYCNGLVTEGATYEEAHAIANGFYEIWTEGNPLQYLYLKYIDDWFDEVDN